MNHYELLYVLPGTLTETEAQEQADKAGAIITKQGGTIIEAHNMGKSRLAYPIKHIRYGYFHLVYFSLEPTDLVKTERPIRLLGQALRMVIRAYDPERNPIDISKFVLNPQTQSAINAEEATVARRTRPAASNTPTETTPSSTDEKPAKDKEIATKTTTESSDISFEQIDEKLDELLEKDLSKV